MLNPTVRTRREMLGASLCVPFVGAAFLTSEACSGATSVLSILQAIDGVIAASLASFGNAIPELVPFIPVIEAYLSAVSVFAGEVSGVLADTTTTTAAKLAQILQDAAKIVIPSFANARAQAIINAVASLVAQLLNAIGITTTSTGAASANVTTAQVKIKRARFSSSERATAANLKEKFAIYVLATSRK